MPQLVFATTNPVKVSAATDACQPYGITFLAKAFDIVEIQAADSEAIARDKAAKAYAITKQPVVVTDDSWLIPGLKGFPGPYMAYMATWLRAEDWLNLTRPLEDRRVTLRQSIAYHDASAQKTFTCDIEGLLLPEARGTHPASPALEIVSFDGGTQSAAERITQYGNMRIETSTAWHDFAVWYNEAHHE